MFEVIGLQEKSGEFEDDHGKTIKYDNIMLYYVTDENPDIIGFFGKEQKIARAKVKLLNAKDWSELLGKQIEFNFSMFTGTPVLSGVKIIGQGNVANFMQTHKKE